MTERDGLELLNRQHIVELANGRSLVLTKLSIADFASCREQALSAYRREKIKAWTDNADLMPADVKQKWIQDAFHRASDICYEDLPRKDIRDEVTGDIISSAEYAAWWMSMTIDGQMHAIWLSLTKHASQSTMTHEDVAELFTDDSMQLDEEDVEKVAQALGELNEPKIVGNGEAPRPAGQKTRRRRRRKT